MDMMAQSLMLAKKPHIIVATPGRLVDHLENTKGFSLRNLKVLVSNCFKISISISIQIIYINNYKCIFIKFPIKYLFFLKMTCVKTFWNHIL